MEALLDAAIGRSGRVRISANAVRQHSRANWISGVYVRPLQPTCLCGEVQPSDPESRERLEILPIGAGDRVFPSSGDSKAT